MFRIYATFQGEFFRFRENEKMPQDGFAWRTKVREMSDKREKDGTSNPFFSISGLGRVGRRVSFCHRKPCGVSVFFMSARKNRRAGCQEESRTGRTPAFVFSGKRAGTACLRRLSRRVANHPFPRVRAWRSDRMTKSAGSGWKRLYRSSFRGWFKVCCRCTSVSAHCSMAKPYRFMSRKAGSSPAGCTVAPSVRYRNSCRVSGT